MAEAKKVRKELLADAMFLDGVTKRRGDLVELDPDQAKRLEAAGLVADEGHLAKLHAERSAAAHAAAEREAEAVRISDADAHRLVAHAQDRLAEPAVASSDGPRTRRKQ